MVCNIGKSLFNFFMWAHMLSCLQLNQSSSLTYLVKYVNFAYASQGRRSVLQHGVTATWRHKAWPHDYHFLSQGWSLFGILALPQKAWMLSAWFSYFCYHTYHIAFTEAVAIVLEQGRRARRKKPYLVGSLEIIHNWTVRHLLYEVEVYLLSNSCAFHGPPMTCRAAPHAFLDNSDWCRVYCFDFNVRLCFFCFMNGEIRTIKRTIF